MGDVFAQMEKNDDAMAQFEASHKIYLAVCGRDHPEVASPLLNMGGLLAKKRNFAKAREKFVEALRIQENAAGLDPSKIEETRTWISLMDRKVQSKTAVLKKISYEEAERIFIAWRDRFFVAEGKYRELYF